MKYKVSFPAGEFEVDGDLSAMGNVELFQKGLISSNPIFAAAKVEVKVEPVMKSYKIMYSQKLCDIVWAESPDVACAKLRKNLKPGEYFMESVEELR